MDPAWEGLIHLGCRVNVPPRVAVVRQGEIPDSICVVEHGSVRVGVINSRGRSASIAIRDSPWLGPHPADLRREASVTITTLCKSQIVWIPARVFRDSLARNPALAFLIQRFASHEAEMLLQARIEAMTDTVSERLLSQIAHYLRARELRLDEVPVTIEISVLQSELADALGCRHEHLNRVLRRFSAQGLLYWQPSGLLLPSPNLLKTSPHWVDIGQFGY